MVERRTMLRGLASGFAGVVAVSRTGAAAGATDQPHAHEDNQPPQRSATSGDASVGLLDDHQRAALTSLAEMLVPGSTAAGVVVLIDRTAALESPMRQRRLLNALGAFEHVARSEHQARWVDLDESTRTAMLQTASDAAPGRPKAPAWTPGQPIVAEPNETAPATIRDHFEYLRTVVADAYYSTEPGMRELGWVGRTGWKELPGCDHSEAEHA